MKISDAVTKIYRYMENYGKLYLEVASLIAIVPDTVNMRIKIYIAGHLHNLIPECEFVDGYMLICVASETVRAAMLVKRIRLAGNQV